MFVTHTGVWCFLPGNLVFLVDCVSACYLCTVGLQLIYAQIVNCNISIQVVSKTRGEFNSMISTIHWLSEWIQYQISLKLLTIVLELISTSDKRQLQNVSRVCLEIWGERENIFLQKLKKKTGSALSFDRFIQEKVFKWNGLALQEAVVVCLLQNILK